MQKVRKAVIPAAGLGTRFLPATKAIAKEMLPIIDKPTIQFIVEEAIQSGIEDIIIVTGKAKRPIEDHFNGSRYLSLYDSKGKWLGYINEKGANVANNKGGVALAAKFNKKVVKRNYTIWQNLNFTKAKANSNQYLNQTLYVKVKYNHYNNSTYYSLYNANNQWLGYINQNATK